MSGARGRWPLVVLLLWQVAAWTQQPPTRSSGDESSYCGEVASDRNSLRDYRLRDSSPTYRWAYDDNKANHMDIDTGRMATGEYSERVMGGLNYTLLRWPNHIPALRALIQYSLAGGLQYKYLPPECYFVRARQFAPEDVDVLQAQAYFYWKRGDKQRARDIYEEAITAHADSAEAQYNAGLLYFELGDYDKALQRAHAAYSLGYPLPGLRKKLERSGRWRPVAAESTSEEQH